MLHIKQILHAFFNIRNYSSEVSNVQRHEAKLSKKKKEYLFYYMSPTPNKIWEDKD